MIATSGRTRLSQRTMSRTTHSSLTSARALSGYRRQVTLARPMRRPASASSFARVGPTSSRGTMWSSTPAQPFSPSVRQRLWTPIPSLAYRMSVPPVPKVSSSGCARIVASLRGIGGDDTRGYARQVSGTARIVVDEVKPALVVLDLGLPDADGVDLFNELRARADTPVIALTARAEDAQKVA